MSGSYNYDENCYIRFRLKAIMKHPTREDENQIYELFLNIMELRRTGVTSAQMVNRPQCCGCCKDYGKTTIELKVETNFAFNGDVIQISGIIDHSRGDTEIEEALVKLEEKRVVIASRGDIRCRDDAEYHFGKIGKVKPG